jgi:hypothetical protein
VIRFYDRFGGQISAYAGSIGAAERWQGAVIEPYGMTTISDFARLNGAEGFRLHVKGAGSEGDGGADVRRKPAE